MLLLCLGVLTVSETYAQSMRAAPAHNHHLGSHTCGTHISLEQANYINQELEKYRKRNRYNQKSSETFNIPIQIHLVKNSSGNMGLDYSDGDDDGITNEQITLADIEASINTLNAYYSNANIQFYQCSSPNEIIDNDLFGYTFDSELALSAYKVPNVINLFYVDYIQVGSGYWWGYTYAPWNPNYTAEEYQDDLLVLAYSSVHNYTLPHEMGHFFGVFHTHGLENASCGTYELVGASLDAAGNLYPDPNVSGSNCGTTGDYICDTPADPNLGGGCWEVWPDDCNYYWQQAVYPDSPVDANGFDYMPLTNNIMSYVTGGCSNSFTDGQYERILEVYHVFRDYLTGDGCDPLNSECPYNIDLDFYYFSNISFEANTSISSSNIILPINNPTDHVLYDAGEYITLTPGFHAQEGCHFTALIDGCGGAFKASEQQPITDATISDFDLSAFPNPLNDQATITYTLDEAATVSLIVRDLAGKVVVELANGIKQESGSYQHSLDASQLSSGMYIYSLQVDGEINSKKLMIAR